MADLDLDQLEKLLDGEDKRGRRSSRTPSRDRRRGDSRDRQDSRDRSTRGRDRYDSRDRGSSRRRYSSRDSSPPARRPSRYKSRTPSPIRRAKREEERKIRQIEREREAAAKESARMQDEAKRDEMTVVIFNLSLKAEERDVWQFLTENCGKVRDIHIVRDARSNKSKGVSYVEFYEHESVLRAFNISGQAYILGQPIRIQASQAERNRAAKIEKQRAQEILAENGPMRVYVGGLVGALATVEEEEITQLFSPFGTIQSSEFPKDPMGGSKGFAFLIFTRASDARDAIQAMNGFEIAGKQIRVGHATGQPDVKPQRELTSLEKAQKRILEAHLVANGAELPDREEDPDVIRDLGDEEDGVALHGDAKVALMRKLARDTVIMPNRPDPVTSEHFRADVQFKPREDPAAEAAATAAMAPPESKNFVMLPLFTAAEVEAEGKGLLEDIVEDVRDELENIGAVQHVHVDPNALDGRVYIRFVHREHAVAAGAKMAGRKYSGNIIQVTWLSDQAWLQVTGLAL